MNLARTPAILRHVELSLLDAPVAMCTAGGVVRSATEAALDVMRRTAVVDGVGGLIPPELWDLLGEVDAGEAVEWRPPGDVGAVLGCTRYHYGDLYFLLVKEVSRKHAMLSARLHRQRLEAIGQLVASVVHELRNAVSNISYSAELLQLEGLGMDEQAFRETLSEMVGGSRRLRSTVDSLLGYARVGPNEFVPVSIPDVLTRSQGFLRRVYRQGSHTLSVECEPDLPRVLGNCLTIEQVFVNMLLNATQASREPVHVRVICEQTPLPGASAISQPMVRARVWDDGPGIPRAKRESIFQPFYSTREEGTGLGLTIAREAVERLGGALVLEPSSQGACFAVYLPPAPAANEAAAHAASGGDSKESHP